MSKTTDYIIEEKNKEFDYLNGLKTIINIIKQQKSEYQDQLEGFVPGDLRRIELIAKIEALNDVLYAWIKS